MPESVASSLRSALIVELNDEAADRNLAAIRAAAGTAGLAGVAGAAAPHIPGRPRRHRKPTRLGWSAGIASLAIAVSGMAAAGALPAPVQHNVARAAAIISIHIPDPTPKHTTTGQSGQSRPSATTTTAAPKSTPVSARPHSSPATGQPGHAGAGHTTNPGQHGTPPAHHVPKVKPNPPPPPTNGPSQPPGPPHRHKHHKHKHHGHRSKPAGPPTPPTPPTQPPPPFGPPPTT